MVQRTFPQRSVFEVLLPDGDKLWDAALRRIDKVLDDEEIVDLVAEALGRHRPQSRLRGRLGTPAEVVLRMLVLKHLYDWSFDECEREVRGSLVYRAFCRIDCERVPDAKTLIRLAQLVGPDALKGIGERLVTLARQRKVIRGRRMRVDTTVVETNIHYPTDSTLLADGVRVLTRTLKKLGQEVGPEGIRLRDRTRSVARRVFEIVQHSRRATKPHVQARMRTLYRELMRGTRAVVRQADTAIEQVAAGAGRGVGLAQIQVEALAEQLRHTAGLVRRVLAQTRARVLKGDTHYPDKVLSLFEPPTEAIRKGKAAKPTEFGKRVKLQEAEAQFITDYEVCAPRVADGDLWEPGGTRRAGTHLGAGQDRRTDDEARAGRADDDLHSLSGPALERLCGNGATMSLGTTGVGPSGRRVPKRSRHASSSARSASLARPRRLTQPRARARGVTGRWWMNHPLSARIR